MKESDLGPEIKTGPLKGHGTPVIDISDFPFTEAASTSIQDSPDEEPDPSTASTTLDYADMIQDDVLVGEFPFSTIIEGIKNQFNDYIGTDDHTDYVEAFYNELHTSINLINQDEEEDHPQEKLDALEAYLNSFVSTMDDLFEQRLAINLMELESDTYDQDELEYEINVLYDYFILNARQTLKNVIVKSISSNMALSKYDDDKTYYNAVNEKLKFYSPLIIAIEPMEFIRLSKNDDVYEMFEDGRVTGNFLRKYTPKLYQYPDFEVDIVSEIVLRQQVKSDLLSPKEEVNI